MVACGGSEPVVYEEIAPAVYMPGPGNACAFILQDDVEGAPTTVLTAQGGSAALTVCGHDGRELARGRGRVERREPGRPGSGASGAATVGLCARGRSGHGWSRWRVWHVRLMATFEGMRGAGVLEITE